MKGTEKQLQYVNDIITSLENALADAKVDPQLATLPESQRDELLARAAKLIEMLRSADYAGDVISVAALAAKGHGQEAFARLGSGIRLTANKLAADMRTVISKPM